MEGFGLRVSAAMKLMEIRKGFNKDRKWVGWPSKKDRLPIYLIFNIFIELSTKFVCMDNILSSESDCLV